MTSNRTINYGNVVQGTAATGLNFTANTAAAGMTSQLLNWYEEGTFTATLSAATPPTTPPTTTAQYTRIGRQVTVTMRFSNVNTSGAAGAMKVTGLPFTSGSVAAVGPAEGAGLFTEASIGYTASSTQIDFYKMASEGTVDIVAGTGKYLGLTLTYFV